MRYLSLILLVFLLSASQSCKTKGKSSTKSNDSLRFESIGFEREGGMTAGKATEEEIFVQGCIEKAIGNDRKAINNFNQVLEMNPRNAAANYEMAGIYRKLEQPERAMKYAQTATDLSPKNRWYKFRYAELLQVNGRHDEATQMFKELSDSEPENIDLLFRYAASLRRAARPGDALKAYERIEKLEGLSDTLANSRIAVYREIGDAAGEEATLMALLKAFPGETKNYNRLGEFYTAHSQPEKAAQVYQDMTVKFPYLVMPYLALARHYKSLGQTDMAFASAVRGFGNSDNPDEKIALLYEWYPVTEAAPALSPVARREADSLCRILRRVHPGKAEPYIASGDYYYKEGRIKEARDQYHLATSIAQEQYAPWKRLLEINDKLKDNATQEKDCKAAMELFPTQPEAYYYLGMIQLAKKDYRNAINNLEMARDYMYDAPKELQIKATLVEAYRNTDDNLKADEYAEEVMEKDSSNLQLIAAYCASLSERRTKLYNAEQLMLRVVAKEPGNASYLEILGWIEYRMNDYKAAKPYMEQALAKEPGNARMNERMGDILFRLGNVDEALKYWKKAKEKGGTNPALERKISSKSMQDNE